MYSRVELRILLIGEMGVGKKSIVKRFKMINASETKIVSIKEESSPNTKENKNSDKNKTITDSNPKEKEKEKNESNEKSKLMKRELKRMELMNFSLIYKIRMNHFEVKFFPCIEALPLEYDYESKEEDEELLQLEKEYKFTLSPLLKEIKEIILLPPENPNNKLEFLFLLCFDLSNIDSFKKLLIYYTQIEKKLKITEKIKIALIGNKIDKKIVINKEDKEEINKFKEKIKANYYEISTMMFFPFDKFFEMIITDNFKTLPILTNREDKNFFHEILMKKNNFSKAERKIGIENGISGEIKFKYNKDQYEYPSTIKGLMQVFQDPDKFNKSIFLTKIGAVLPPLKSTIKDNLPLKDSQNKLISRITPGIKLNPKNKKIQEALELTSRKPGYTFGFKFNTKSLNLKKQRKALSEARYSTLEQFMKEHTTQLYEYKNHKSKKKEIKSQVEYEKNRNEIKQRKEEDYFIINEEKEKRHEENLQTKEKEEKERIDKLIQKRNKYDERHLKNKEEKEQKRMDNIIKNIKNNLHSSKIFTKSKEPKAKFYTPKSYLLTNKGFSFGHKFSDQGKIEKKDYPEFPLFKDDFEKIILKNKKIINTSTGERFPENKTEEIIEDTKMKQNQEKYDKIREMHQMNKTAEFREKREEWKEKVESNKKRINLIKDINLEEYIRKTYKGDNNYFKREINYTQVESSSPKFSFREKTQFGSIFPKKDNSDKYSNNTSTKLSTLYLENPDIRYTHIGFPKYSFGKSKRFNITTDTFQEKEDYYSNTDYNYTQSFLKAQTFMGTGKKMEMKYNGVPGPNAYEIKRFADDVVEKSKIKVKYMDSFFENK